MDLNQHYKDCDPGNGQICAGIDIMVVQYVYWYITASVNLRWIHFPYNEILNVANKHYM